MIPLNLDVGYGIDRGLPNTLSIKYFKAGLYTMNIQSINQWLLLKLFFYMYTLFRFPHMQNAHWLNMSVCFVINSSGAFLNFHEQHNDANYKSFGFTILTLFV